MGQGLYDLLGWGVLTPPPLDNNLPAHKALGATLYERGLRRAYETTPDYLVIRLAVSEPFLQDEGGLPDLPDDCPRVRPRCARIVELPMFVVPAGACTRWQEAQALYQQVGLLLPEAQLILASDWD